MLFAVRWFVYCFLFFIFSDGVAAAQSWLDGRLLRLNQIHDVIWDESRRRLIVASGTELLSIDPSAPAVVETLLSGNHVSCMALAADNQSLYVGYSSRSVIERLRISSKTVDLQIALSNDQGQPQAAAGIVIGPQPNQLMVALGSLSVSSTPSVFSSLANSVVAFEGTSLLGAPLALPIRSLYRRSTDGSIFALGQDRIYRLSFGARGPTIQASGGTTPLFSNDSRPTWNPRRVVDRAGSVFDLESLRPIGKINLAYGCPLGFRAQGDRLLAYATDPIAGRPPRLISYLLDRFLPESELPLAANNDFSGACSSFARTWTFGTNGFAIASIQQNGSGSNLLISDSPEMMPVQADPWPEPTLDSTGVLKLILKSNGIAYDARHSRIWASVPGDQPGVGNSLVEIDPVSGKILDSVFVGAEPGMLSLSLDGSRLFVLLPASQSVAVFDTEAKRLVRTFSLHDFALPNARTVGAWTLISLAAVGTTPDRVAVSLAPLSENSFISAAAVFENGVALPAILSNFRASGAPDPGTPLFSLLMPGDSPNSLYAINPLQSGGGNRRIYRLSVNDEGIHYAGLLNSIKVGAGHSGGFWAVADGRVYSGEGEVWTSDLQTLLGTVSIDQSYATRGIPVPLPDKNQLVMVHGSPPTRQSAITTFELDSWRPLGTLPVPGAEVSVSSRVDALRAGGDRIAISFNDQIQIIPLSSLSSWPGSSAAADSVAPGVRRIRLPALSIAAADGGRKLLIATASKAGALGNSIVSWNVARNEVDSQMDAGSEPTMLAVGPDSQYAWAILQGERRVARYNLTEQRRDIVFQPATVSPLTRYPVFSLAAAANGSAAISFTSGLIRMYDGESARPVAECNVGGTAGASGGFLRVLLNETGDRLYAFRGSGGETPVFKRCHVGEDGLRWMSNSNHVVSLHWELARITRGFLFNSFGQVYEVERSRPVANLYSQLGSAEALLPDLESNRVFYILNRQLLVFDWKTKARIGLLHLPLTEGTVVQPDMVLLGSQQLAFRTNRDEVYLIDLPAIPASDPLPVPPQPDPPVTSGVTAIPLAANDLAYDASRNLLYAAVPNSAGVDGDSIAAIDPASGEIRSRMPVGLNPRILALAADHSRLFFTTGILTGSSITTGLSPVSESIQGLNLSTGNTGPSFPARQEFFANSYVYLDITPLRGAGARIAALDSLFQAGGSALFNLGINSLRIYEDDSSRPDFLGFRSLSCLFMVAGEPGRLYCTNGSSVDRLAVNDRGVAKHSHFSLLPARGALGRMVYRDGKLYTATGQVIEAETGRTLFRLNAQGAVALDDKHVYWLDSREASRWLLRIHSRDTLEPVATMPIAVAPGETTRLVSLGSGRLAFAAGHFIYLVRTGVE